MAGRNRNGLRGVCASFSSSPRGTDAGLWAWVLFSAAGVGWAHRDSSAWYAAVLRSAGAGLCGNLFDRLEASSDLAFSG